MPEVTVAKLLKLDGKAYANEVKRRLTDNDAWLILLDPRLVEKTRFALTRMIVSIDAQKVRAALREPMDTPEARRWLHGIGLLRGYVTRRLEEMPTPVELPSSSTKEARAWRAFSAQLADELAKVDPEALERIRAPYGVLTASQWRSARQAKAAN